MSVKIGFLACHSENYYAAETQVIDRCRKGLQDIAEPMGIKIVTTSPVMDAEGAKAAKKAFQEEKVDYLLLLNASFSTGDIMMEFEQWETPMGVWAIPELKKEGDIALNATVSGNMYISIAQRTYQTPKKIKWFYGYPEEELCKKRFQVTFQALKGYKAIRAGKIGVLGGVAPTFYNLANAGTKEEEMGISFVHFTMEDLCKEVKLLKKEEIKYRKQQIIISAEDCSSVPEQSLEEGAKVLSVLVKWTEQYHISAWAASCWPDFQEHFSIVPCVPFTLLAKLKGVPVACEGDIGGAISLLFAKAIAGYAPTLMDLASLEFEQEQMLLWHCGIGSVDLMPKQGSRMIPHPMLDRKNPDRKEMGLAYDYLFREVPVTVLRYTNDHRLFAFEGKINNQYAGYTGTRGYVTDFTSRKQATKLGDIVETIMSQGIEHHLILVPGHIEEALHECAALAGLSWINMEKYTDGL